MEDEDIQKTVKKKKKIFYKRKKQILRTIIQVSFTEGKVVWKLIERRHHILCRPSFKKSIKTIMEDKKGNDTHQILNQFSPELFQCELSILEDHN